MTIKVKGGKDSDNGEKYERQIFTKDNRKQNIIVGIIAIMGMVFLLVIVSWLSGIDITSKWLSITGQNKQTLQFTPGEKSKLVDLINNAWTKEEKEMVIVFIKSVTPYTDKIVRASTEYANKDYSFKEMDRFVDRTKTRLNSIEPRLVTAETDIRHLEKLHTGK